MGAECWVQLIDVQYQSCCQGDVNASRCTLCATRPPRTTVLPACTSPHLPACLPARPPTRLQIRRLPKPVVAAVAGYAVGGGHILHMMCDLTIAADNAVFGQTGPKVGSFDAGYGSTQVGWEGLGWVLERGARWMGGRGLGKTAECRAGQRECCGAPRLH